MAKRIKFLILLMLIASPARADFTAYVGNFTTNTSTGNQSVTGVGFQPKVVIFVTGNATATGLTNDASALSLGVAESSSARWAMSLYAQDNTPQAVDDRRFTTTSCITINNNGSVTVAADFVSMDADGFTVNITTAPGTGIIVGFMALGGSDLSVKVGTFDYGTGTGSTAITGVGFQPKVLLVGSALSNTTEGNATSYINMVGAAESSSEREASNAQGDDTADPSVTARIWTNSYFIRRPGKSTATHEADFTSFDSDGFTFNIVTGGTDIRIGYLAMRGIDVDVGNFTQKTSTGTKSETGIGFTPKALFIFSNTAITASGTSTTTGTYMHGMAAGSAEFMALTSEAEAQATSVCSKKTSTTKAAGTVSAGNPGTQASEADFSSFDSDGFTFDWTTADANARVFEFIALGETVVTPPPSDRRIITV
jgi:hypothetical protein